MRPMILICVLALIGCSDDSGSSDALPGLDSCGCDHRMDLPPADLTVDASADGPVDAAADEKALIDATSLEGGTDAVPDSAPVDIPVVEGPPTDLPAGAKLIEYAQCSTDKTCEPYCGAIGSKSEGWFDGCTSQLLKHPTSGVPYWDQCATCTVSCDAIGSYSEGWYAHCP